MKSKSKCSLWLITAEVAEQADLWAAAEEVAVERAKAEVMAVPYNWDQRPMSDNPYLTPRVLPRRRVALQI